MKELATKPQNQPYKDFGKGYKETEVKRPVISNLKSEILYAFAASVGRILCEIQTDFNEREK